jgi:hypothetical protein
MNERCRRSSMELDLIEKHEGFRTSRMRVINDTRIRDKPDERLRGKFDMLVKLGEDKFNNGELDAAAGILGFAYGLKWWAQIRNNHINGPGLEWEEDLEHLLTALHEALI